MKKHKKLVEGVHYNKIKCDHDGAAFFSFGDKSMIDCNRCKRLIMVPRLSTGDKQ